MLGFSIQGPVFLGRYTKETERDLIGHCDTVEQFLQILKDNGIHSIEIRILPRGAEESAYIGLIQRIWDHGFRLTVHGHVEGEMEGSSFADVYPSMTYILNHFDRYQDGLTMAIHAYDAKEGSELELHHKTVKLLRNWSGRVGQENLPLRFALENNRKKPIKVDPGDSIEGVVRMVEEIDSPHVGITWDMGHFYSNLLVERKLQSPPEQPLLDLPDKSFLKRVIHTHIHGLGRSGTHNPLTETVSLPLEHYVHALKQHEYKGVYNLELTLSKFEQDLPLLEHTAASIQRLKQAVG